MGFQVFQPNTWHLSMLNCQLQRTNVVHIVTFINRIVINHRKKEIKTNKDPSNEEPVAQLTSKVG